MCAFIVIRANDGHGAKQVFSARFESIDLLRLISRPERSIDVEDVFVKTRHSRCVDEGQVPVEVLHKVREMSIRGWRGGGRSRDSGNGSIGRCCCHESITHRSCIARFNAQTDHRCSMCLLFRHGNLSRRREDASRLCDVRPKTEVRLVVQARREEPSEVKALRRRESFHGGHRVSWLVRRRTDG